MRVAIAGCGLIGRKRAEALRGHDRLVGCFDVVQQAAADVAATFGTVACPSMEALLELEPDAVVVAVTHERLAALSIQALEAGAHVLVEKPAGLSVAQVNELIAASARTGCRVKVGFNHRYHVGIDRIVCEARSGVHGDVLYLRGRYGHGGRPGYDREWRAQPTRSGGGEIVDQGFHLLDLSHWLLGRLPLNAALVRTHFWDTPVDDNAVLVLGDRHSRVSPWALLHVSWTEWKNMFSLEIYCRRAKLQVDGLARSYGPQIVRVHRMSEQLGPPETEVIRYPEGDDSWRREWEHFCERLADGAPMGGALEDARYAWDIVERAYSETGYDQMRRDVP